VHFALLLPNEQQHPCINQEYLITELSASSFGASVNFRSFPVLPISHTEPSAGRDPQIDHTRASQQCNVSVTANFF